jgi:PhoPQ-activated pathogenicity-related protein
MKFKCLAGWFCLALALSGLSCVTTPEVSPNAREVKRPTALDQYVYTDDPSFCYSVAGQISGEGLRMYVLDMVSQTWRTPLEVDRTEWQHWVSIYVPDTVLYDTALLYIGGGSNDERAPREMAREFAQVALNTESIVIYLGMVPNQPLVFADDKNSRVEDELIAYTWDKYLRTGDENWPARNPMTKSVVRAMDAAQEFCSREETGGHALRSFVVAGGSKRGWTTWTTAAVDNRVRAIVPIVIDMLNVKASFKHHWEAYGRWAPAVGDYEDMGLMEWLGTEEYDRLLELVEPYSYRERYTMPKLLINSCGDQFFLPDSSQFYWDGLIGDKYLRYVPNTGHGLEDSDALFTMMAFYHAIISDTPLPQYSWSYNGTKTLTVTTPSNPVEVRFWKATNPDARDFRVDTVGKIWESVSLEPTADGRYSVFLETPARGWTAQMMELTFEGPKGTPLKYTTPVRVLPERTPYTYTLPLHPPKGFLSRK